MSVLAGKMFSVLALSWEASASRTMSLSVGVLMTSYHTLKTQGLRKLGVADPGQRPQA